MLCTSPPSFCTGLNFWLLDRDCATLHRSMQGRVLEKKTADSTTKLNIGKFIFSKWRQPDHSLSYDTLDADIYFLDKPKMTPTILAPEHFGDTIFRNGVDDFWTQKSAKTRQNLVIKPQKLYQWTLIIALVCSKPFAVHLDNFMKI